MKNLLLLSLFLFTVLPPAFAAKERKLFFPADNSADRMDAYEQEAEKEKHTAEKRLFKQLRSEVRNGYTDSLMELAMAYYRGYGVKKNYKKAYKYMQKAAQNGDALAAVLQANWLSRGKGTAKNIPLACELLQELVQNQNPHAAFQLYTLGKQNYCGLTETDTQQLLDFAAEKGVAPALFYKSQNAQSPQKSFTFMERAARLEYRLAQYELARMSENGTGTETNPAKAFDYMMLAAKQKLKEAQWQTARWYEQGYGVKQSPSLAFHWTRIAAKNNVKDAQKRLAEMYRTGYGVPVNVGAARKWEKKASAAAKTEETEEEFY